MNAGLVTHLTGMVLATAALGCVALGARRLRARLLPDWTGPPATLATLTIGLTVVVLVTQALGAVGLFRSVPMTAGLIAAGLGTRWWATRAAGTSDRAPVVDDPLMGREATIFAAVAVVVVTAEWLQRTFWALHEGIHTVDSVWYHLPVSARWTQTGWITPLHFLEGEPLTTFYPANASIVHGLGMLFLGHDLLSVGLNLAWLALGLLAAWCIGRPLGLGPLALGVAAVVCATPSLVATQPGGAYNDMAGIALISTALAIVTTARHGGRTMQPAELVLAAAATGLALGTKFQFLIPAGALTLAVVALAPAGQRVRATMWWSGSLAVTGSFWYVRNLIAVGNPLPHLDLELGPLRLYAAPTTTPFSTLADYLADGEAWREFLWPGFAGAVGDVWWLLLGGLVLYLVRGALAGPLARSFSFVTVVTLVGFVFSPAVYGWGDDPEYVGVVLRYIAPALMLGGMAAVVAAAHGPSGWRWGVLGLFSGYLVSLQVDASDWGEIAERAIDRAIWDPLSLGWVAVAAGVLATGAVLWRAAARGTARPPERSRQLQLVAATLLMAMVVSVPVRRYYLEHRYQDPEFLLRLQPLSWAVDLRDERIALTNHQFQYPAYGPDLSNHVQYLGERGPHGAWGRVTSCERWRELLNEGDYTYVETAPSGWNDTDPPRYTAWTMDDPAVTEVYARRDVRVYRLDGDLDPDGCPPD